MAKKKVAAVVKIQIPAGQGHARRRPSAPRSAPTAWPSWTSARTTTPPPRPSGAPIVPVEITVFEDRSFTFVLKTPPTPVLLRAPPAWTRARPRPVARRPARSPRPRSTEIAQTKMPDLNANDLEAAPSPGRRHRPLDGHARSCPDGTRSTGAVDRTAPVHTHPGATSPGGQRPTEGATMAKGKRFTDAQQALRPRPALHAGRGPRPGEEPGERPSSTRPSSWPSAWASIPARPTRWCAAPSALPSGTGKDVRVAVFAAGEAAAEARAAGADIVGADDLAAQVEKAACSTSTWPSPRPT